MDKREAVDQAFSEAVGDGVVDFDLRCAEFTQALDELVAAKDSEIERLTLENERLRGAYGRLVERLRLAIPRSLMALSDIDSVSKITGKRE